MLAFRDAAEAMVTPQLVLARQVAHLERAAMGVDDAPGLRVLWWQCVAEALQAHIAQEQGNSDEWRVELSPTAALRYAEAGGDELVGHTHVAEEHRQEQPRECRKHKHHCDKFLTPRHRPHLSQFRDD